MSPPLSAISGMIPGTYVRLLFEYLGLQQVDAESLLGEACPELNQERSYTGKEWCQMLTHASRHLGDPDLGVHIAARITPAHLGPLGYVLLASNSVAAVIERYMRYQRLVHDVSPVQHYLQGDRLVLQWGDESRQLGLLVNQCGLAALLQFTRNITGHDLVPAAVYFVESTPDDVTVLQAFFRCPLVFAAEALRIDFPASVLALPLRQPDAHLVTMLEQHVQRLFAALPSKDDLLGEVRRLLSHQLPLAAPSIERIAETLGCSSRTIRRRLALSGWQFRELLEDTRLHLAQDYLRDYRLALPEVALLLGYSEQSAFNRAFRRWTGQSPLQWRKRELR